VKREAVVVDVAMVAGEKVGGKNGREAGGEFKWEKIPLRFRRRVEFHL
jgi:hypothetical protein